LMPAHPSTSPAREALSSRIPGQHDPIRLRSSPVQPRGRRKRRQGVCRDTGPVHRTVGVPLGGPLEASYERPTGTGCKATEDDDEVERRSLNVEADRPPTPLTTCNAYPVSSGSRPRAGNGETSGGQARYGQPDDPGAERVINESLILQAPPLNFFRENPVTTLRVSW